MAESLPPVVAVIEARIDDLVSKIATAKQEVRSMDGVTGTAHAEVDTSGVTTGVAAATAEVEAFGALRADATIGVNGSPLSGITSGVLSGLLAGGAADAAGGAAGGGGGGMGIMGMLLFGGGGIAGIGAGFGSIMGMMGFGMEHLVTTAIGLIGSAMGAMAGGGLLALGGLGVLGVGMGVDMGVSAGSLSDLKTATTDYQALTAAVQQYGAGSYQAAQAQANLNMAMATVPSAARASTLATAISMANLGAAFSKATGPAENLFMQIAQGAIKVATNYIPLVGAAATRNFTLIKAGLQPLFAYLSGPGTVIFQELENLFAKSLPYAMNALNQGVQLLLKTMALVAPQTGGLIKWISEFLTKMNTPAGFAKWSVDVGKLIFMFHVWWDLLKQVAITVFDLFSNSKGLGTGIVTTITGMLKSLDKWLTATGKSSIGRLFEVHKKEVIDLLNVLGPLAAAIGKLYIAISPVLIGALIAVLVPLTAFIKLVSKNPVAAFLLGLTGLVLASASLRGGVAALAGVFGGWGAIMDALLGPVGLVIAALVGIGAILVLSYIHFKTFRDVVNTVVGNVASAFVHLYHWVSSEVQGLQRWLHTHWAQITDDASIAWNIVSTTVKIAWEGITSIIHGALVVIVPILQVAWSILFNATTIAWTIITSTIRLAVLGITDAIHGISDVIGFLTGVWKTVTSDISTAVGDIGKIFGGVVSAITSPFATAFNAIKSLWNSTMGNVHFSIPKWVPVIGGDSWGFPKMALGGYLGAGMPAIVGENGPELFMPRQSGSIVPNGQFGGGVQLSVSNTITIQGNAGPSTVAQMKAVLSVWERDLVQRLQGA